MKEKIERQNLHISKEELLTLTLGAIGVLMGKAQGTVVSVSSALVQRTIRERDKMIISTQRISRVLSELAAERGWRIRGWANHHIYMVPILRHKGVTVDE